MVYVVGRAGLLQTRVRAGRQSKGEWLLCHPNSSPQCYGIVTYGACSNKCHTGHSYQMVWTESKALLELCVNSFVGTECEDSQRFGFRAVIMLGLLHRQLWKTCFAGGRICRNMISAERNSSNLSGTGNRSEYYAWENQRELDSNM